jgi:hypothetical protein
MESLGAYLDKLHISHEQHKNSGKVLMVNIFSFNNAHHSSITGFEGLKIDVKEI